MTTPGYDLRGRAALVTGGGVGIGQAVVEALAGAGAYVGIHYHSSRDGAAKTLAGVEKQGGRGVLLQGDLTKPEACRKLVDDLAAAAGRLDILFNNAGFPVQKVKLEDCPLEVWQQSLAINLTCAFLVTQRAIPHLRKSGQGAIINNLSLSVQTGGAGGAGAYAAAKGGLMVMTRTLARELAPAIRTNSIMPGVIDTRHHEMFSTPERMEFYKKDTPLGRLGVAAEVAAVVLFLASDASRFVNGALIDINGGRFLR